jgi:3',5'-cyclic AMP phosphodiesterase CpdA
MRRKPFVFLAGFASLALGLVIPARTQPLRAALPQTPVATLVGAGDIAGCGQVEDTATAKLMETIPGTVFTLGDNVYNDGSAKQFANCYGPTWGRFKARTRPVPGNHDYFTPNAAGYFDYFGAAAGSRTKGYYSYNAGAWHVIVLNSNCAAVGGCGPGSPQERWLRADLAASKAACTVAMWHHPRFASGRRHGSDPRMAAFWWALYQYGAELVLSGHEHFYERFAPQRPNATADPAFGIRQFVVGTGGNGHYPIGAVVANSQVRNDRAAGVLKLVLRPQSYEWAFVPILGRTFRDSGTGTCHGRPPAQQATTTTTRPPATTTTRPPTTTTTRPPSTTTTR